MRPTRTQLEALWRRDPVLARAARGLPSFPDFPRAGPPEVRSHFHALARSVVHQQVSTQAARTIWKRCCALTPGRGLGGSRDFLALEDDALRAAGLSRGKALSLRDLAQKIEDGELRPRRLHRLKDEEVIAELVRVRGIGEWTAQMFLLFRLGRPDVMAPADLGLQEGLRRLDGLEERPRPAELARRAEAWRPLRSVASWILWRLTDA